MKLRRAAVAALGKAKLLPEQKRDLIRILHTVAVTKGDGDEG